MAKETVNVLIFIFLLCSCHINTGNSGSNHNRAITPAIEYEYIGAYPHDINSFTEGLLVHEGRLYESTGSPKEFPQANSLFGTVDLSTGKINIKVKIDRKKYFGEGITILDGKIYQLTYKSKIGFIYDANNFDKIAEFPIPSIEGWGLTTNGSQLIMSDGTDVLTYLNPDNLNVTNRISVTENGYVLDKINELEYIKGFIYANIWTTNTIVKIDPTNGNVVGKLDLTVYANDSKNLNYNSLEMNGIAYDSKRDRVYITGKFWPKIYELKLKY